MNTKDMIKQAIYRPSHEENDQVEGYPAFARIVKGIENALLSRYGMQYKLYASDDANTEYWDLLEEDVKNGYEEVDHVAPIFERLEQRTFSYDEERDEPSYNVYQSIMNNVFAYPKSGVAFARIPIFSNITIIPMNCVFAVGDHELSEFLSNVRKRLWKHSMKSITVFTDTQEGMEREKELIVRAVERFEVVMNPDVKKEIYRSLDQFFSDDRTFYHTYNIPYKRGILLYGPPGNGKTTLVKSIAGSIKAPVAYWQITEFTSSESIAEVFQSARKLAPMVLVIEDIDSMPEEARSFFLNTLDGATSKEGIFLIGTTNYPEKIDPGLMNRAGRFDRAYEIALPNEALRLQYLKMRGFEALMTAEETAEIARLTDGFSFAQLGELYVSAALEWHQEGKMNIDQIVKAMKGEQDKGRKGSWNDSTRSRVGFQ